MENKNKNSYIHKFKYYYIVWHFDYMMLKDKQSKKKYLWLPYLLEWAPHLGQKS